MDGMGAMGKMDAVRQALCAGFGMHAARLSTLSRDSSKPFDATKPKIGGRADLRSMGTIELDRRLREWGQARREGKSYHEGKREGGKPREGEGDAMRRGGWRRRQYESLTSGMAAEIYPDSVLFHSAVPYNLVIYHDLLLTSKPYLHCVTAVQPQWLAAACPALYTFLPPAHATRVSKRERRLEGRGEGGKEEVERHGGAEAGEQSVGGSSDTDWNLASSWHHGVRDEFVGGAGLRGERCEREGVRVIGPSRDVVGGVGDEDEDVRGRGRVHGGRGGEGVGGTGGRAQMSAVQAAFLGIQRGKGRKVGG
jgi:hypothetical protein